MVRIQKPGESAGQGVGYLEDGDDGCRRTRPGIYRRRSGNHRDQHGAKAVRPNDFRPRDRYGGACRWPPSSSGILSYPDCDLTSACCLSSRFSRLRRLLNHHAINTHFWSNFAKHSICMRHTPAGPAEGSRILDTIAMISEYHGPRSHHH